MNTNEQTEKLSPSCIRINRLSSLYIDAKLKQVQLREDANTQAVVISELRKQITEHNRRAVEAVVADNKQQLIIEGLRRDNTELKNALLKIRACKSLRSSKQYADTALRPNSGG